VSAQRQPEGTARQPDRVGGRRASRTWITDGGDAVHDSTSHGLPRGMVRDVEVTPSGTVGSNLRHTFVG
jgi:hypothetical protein